MMRRIVAIAVAIGAVMGWLAPVGHADVVAASFDVPATGQVVGVHLDFGVYLVKVFGTIHYDTSAYGPAYADAECTSPDSAISLDAVAYSYNLYPSPLSGWQSHRYLVQGFPTDLLDLEVDTIAPEWVPSLPTPVAYDPLVGGPGVDIGCNEVTHTYEYVLTSIGANHTFRIFDPAAADNDGSLHVEITQLA